WRRVTCWSVLTAIYIAGLPFWLPIVVDRLEAYHIPARALAAVLMIAPAGLLMGFGFPTGMRLVNSVDRRPTPWFWAINGAASVLAAGIAVAVNIAFSINVSIWVAAACYLLVGMTGAALLNKKIRHHATDPVIALGSFGEGRLA